MKCWQVATAPFANVEAVGVGLVRDGGLVGWWVPWRDPPLANLKVLDNLWLPIAGLKVVEDVLVLIWEPRTITKRDEGW